MPKNTAKLTFWGVRGSTPSVDRETWRYGGNTPCLELVTPGGSRIILDCGTGLRMLGKRWAGESGVARAAEAHIFVTHYHWDHIQGLPFFAPLYSPKNRFHFYSFRSEFLGPDSLKRVLEAQMAFPYFPVSLSSMSAAREFTEIAGGDRRVLGDACVTARWLNHPQGCLGFRFETPAGTIVYATDNEPGTPDFDRALRELGCGRRRPGERCAVHARATGSSQGLGPFELARRRPAGQGRRSTQPGALSPRPRFVG